MHDISKISFLPRQALTLTTAAPPVTAAGPSLGEASNKTLTRSLCAGELLFLFLLKAENGWKNWPVDKFVVIICNADCKVSFQAWSRRMPHHDVKQKEVYGLQIPGLQEHRWIWGSI